MKKLIILIMMLSMLLVACEITDPEDAVISHTEDTTPTKKAEPTEEPQEEVITVSAVDLLKAYDENEVKADNLYKGKTLEVTGDVKSIGKDILDKVYITLGDKDETFAIISVQCYFKDDAEIDKVAELSEGDKVTVVGTGDGGTLNVMMKNCIIK